MTSGGDQQDEGRWVLLAMSDPSVVAELLMRLGHAKSRPSSPSSSPRTLNLDWTVRQRRTRQPPQPTSAAVAAARNACKKTGGDRDLNRASPTTPLSWSGATSTSGCGGEESPLLDNIIHDNSNNNSLRSKEIISEMSPLRARSRRSLTPRRRQRVRPETVRLCSVGQPPPPPTVAGSIDDTVSIASAATGPCSGSTAAATKKPRKKKTLAELKEEESLLLKERRNLKNELATLRLNFDKERSINESLKRIKVDILQVTKLASPEQHEQCSQEPFNPAECSQKGSSDLDQVVTRQHLTNFPETKKFEIHERMDLPDLNLPLDDAAPDILCEAS